MYKKPCAVILFVIVASIAFAQQPRNTAPQNASASQKFALVIGNAEYTGLGRLTNPVNDANDVANALTTLGFTVDKVLNGSLERMEGAITRLKNRLSASTETYGFFFYAGHGVQSNGENYLIPVDANIPNENYLRNRAVSVQVVLDDLNEAGNSLNVVVLDACRDNPFGWGRSGTRGLAIVSRQPADSIIVYATSAGQRASDGQGRNGLFTSQLLKNLTTPGLEVKEVFNRTGADVSSVSGRQQVPAVYNQFFGTAYLGTLPVTFEQGTVSTAVGALEISTITAGTVEIVGAAINEKIELPAWSSLPITKIDAGNYRVTMRYEDGKIEEKTIQIGRAESAKLEFSYNPIVQPVPLPSPPAQRQREATPDTRLWTLGASAGTSFTRPWLIGTVHGTLAPFNYSFLDIGLDVGMLRRALRLPGPG